MSRPDRHRTRVGGAGVTELLVAGVLGAGLLVTGSASLAAAATEGVATLAIVDQSFGVVAGTPWRVTVAADGLSLAADARVVVTAHEPLTSSTDVDSVSAWRASDAVGLAATALGSDGTIEVSTGTGAAVAGDTVLQLNEPGVIPMTVAVASGGATVARATTFVSVSAPGASGRERALDIAIVAGIDDPGPWPTDDAPSLAGLASLTTLADAVDAPVSVRLPPTVAALAAPDVPAPDSSMLPDLITDASEPAATATPTASLPQPSAPIATDPHDTTAPTAPIATTSAETAATDLTALSEGFAGDELLPAPFVDLDPSSVAAIDRAPLFANELRDGENTLVAAVPLADGTRDAWLTSRGVSATAASQLRTLGVRMLVVSPEVASSLGVDVDPISGAAFAVALDGGDRMPALAVSPLGAALGPPDDDTTPAVSAATTMAALLMDERTPTAVALGVRTESGGFGVPDAAVTARVAAYASEVPGVSVVPLSSLTGAVNREATSDPVALPDESGLDLTGRVTLIDMVVGDAARAVSMIAEPDLAPDWTGEFNRMLSSAIDDGEAGAHLAAVDAEVRSILGALVPPDPFTFTLTGTSSRLPFSLENTSPYDLNVVIRVSSAKLEGETTTQLLRANTTTDVKIPVRARSNGSFSVEVSFYPPGGGLRLTDPVVLRANATRLSGVSRVVTVGALLALASWWYSHFRKSRAVRAAR